MTTRAEPAALCDGYVEMDGCLKIDVGSGCGPYPVLVGPVLGRVADLLKRFAPAYRYAVVSDSNVAQLWGDRVVSECALGGLEAELFVFPAGEEHKTRESWRRLTDALLSAGMGRDSCVVAVGGGVTGDLAGFVAATFLRGVKLVQVPTSYLAMIDASVGGKVGVDTALGKNLVGAFHAPSLVLADPAVLATLPARERIQGLVEAVKHGAVLDPDHLEALVQEARGLVDADEELARTVVADSVRIKVSVVARDEREGGYREVLNFGHTVAHAVEAASGYRIPHGSAVAWGMVVEARVGERLGITEIGTRDLLVGALRGLGVDLERVRGLAANSHVVGYLNADKKSRRGETRMVLLKRIGEVARADDGSWSHGVDEALMGRSLAARA